MNRGFQQYVEDYQAARRTNKEEAIRIYVEHLLPTILEHALEKWKETNEGKSYDHLIATVGLSPEPTILTIIALQPKEVSFLVTEESRRELDLIIQGTGLKPSRWRAYEIDDSTMVEIYKNVREITKRCEVRRIAMDISGGKKLMSAGAALAAAQAEIDILYVDYLKYDANNHRPVIGTEYILHLEDPIVVFGERELEEIKAKCRRHDYAGAAEAITKVLHRVPEPRDFEIYHELASAYKLWEDFNFRKARSCLIRAVKRMEQYRRLPDLKEKVEQQVDLLAPLESVGDAAYGAIKHAQKAWLLIGCCLTNGKRREEQSRWDMASLLMYRTLEMTFQRRLACYGIDTREPDYSKLDIPKETLFERFKAEYVKAIEKKRESYGGTSLPGRIALMDGAVLLRVIGDQSLAGINLGDLRDSIDHRNQSILAHGIKRIEKGDYEKMAQMVLTIVQQAWELEEVTPFGLSLDDLLDRLSFACLD